MSKMKYNPITGELETVDVTTQDIIIDGDSPLASALDRTFWPDYWKGPDGNPIIPKGETLDSILQELFVKTVDGNVSWQLGDWKPVVIPSNIDFTPIAECHGGIWKYVSDKSFHLENNVMKATLRHSHGYFLSLEDHWRNAPLIVDIFPSVRFVSPTYKKDGITTTRNPGNWTTERLNLDFDQFSVITEEAVLRTTISAGLKYDAVYASTNKKRVAPNVHQALGIADNLTLDVPYLASRTIYASYYYFKTTMNDTALEGVFASPITSDMFTDKSFIHQLVVDADGVTVVTCPNEINFLMQVPAGLNAVVIVPSLYAVDSNGNDGWYRRLAAYTSPDGTIVDYMAWYYKNNTSNTISLPVIIKQI